MLNFASSLPPHVREKQEMSKPRSKFVKPKQGSDNESLISRFLYVAGVGSQLGSCIESIRALFSTYGSLDYSEGDAVEMLPGMRITYISFMYAKDAQTALEALQGKVMDLSGIGGIADNNATNECVASLGNIQGIESLALEGDKDTHKNKTERGPNEKAPKQKAPSSRHTRLYIRYAARVVDNGLPQPEDVATTADVHIPGLKLIENFISEEEERELVVSIGAGDRLDPPVLDSPNEQCSVAPWEDVLKRRVQHYGFKFHYRTLLLDYASCPPPLPPLCQRLAQRMRASLRGEERNEKEDGKRKAADGIVASPSTTLPPLPPDTLVGPAAAAAPEGSTVTEACHELNQLTVNEYECGQGIAGHVDSHMCFGPEVHLRIPIYIPMLLLAFCFFWQLVLRKRYCLLKY